MVTEKDEIMKKIRGTINRDWRLNGFQNEICPQKVLILESGMIRIDPRFTSHC